MNKQTFAQSVILTSFIGLTACGSHMVVDDGAGASGPIDPVGTGGGSPDVVSVAGVGGGSPITPQQCGGFIDQPTSRVKPVDIIVVIDNSNSMAKEIKAVEENINTNFATVLEDSGLDYRVVMFSLHGKSNSTGNMRLCVTEPLADFSKPDTGCSSTQLPGNNPGKFYHYSTQVKSTDSLTLLLTQFAGENAEDAFGLAPGGYHQWLRPEAFKIFIEITDDNVDEYEVYKKNVDPNMIFQDFDTVEGGEQAAAAFDAQLLKLSPDHFGTAEERNYRFYSIVGMPSKDPQNPNEPWLPEDPFTNATGTCASDSTNHGRKDAGTGYQALSRLTGGLRFSLCHPEGFNVVFNHLAQGVIEHQQVACEFTLPTVLEGEYIDLPSVSVNYTAGGEAAAQTFEQVTDEAACTEGAFYIDGDVVRLCAQTCATVQGDLAAELEWSFMCLDDIN